MGKQEDEKFSFLPGFTIVHDFICPMILCVIKHDNSLLLDAKRQIIKIFYNFVRVDGFCCGKPIIIGVSIDYFKAIEHEFLSGRE
jgi:hypothetical protein